MPNINQSEKLTHILNASKKPKNTSLALSFYIWMPQTWRVNYVSRVSLLLLWWLFCFSWKPLCPLFHTLSTYLVDSSRCQDVVAFRSYHPSSSICRWKFGYYILLTNSVLHSALSRCYPSLLGLRVVYFTKISRRWVEFRSLFLRVLFSSIGSFFYLLVALFVCLVDIQISSPPAYQGWDLTWSCWCGSIINLWYFINILLSLEKNYVVIIRNFQRLKG